LAESLRGTGVTVNSVLPGPTLSESLQDFLEEKALKEGKTTEQAGIEFVMENRPDSLIERPLASEEVANMIVYVCSPLASGSWGDPFRVEGRIIRSIA